MVVDPVLRKIYDPQRLNRYSYCHNDPINYIDPDGGFELPAQPSLSDLPDNSSANPANGGGPALLLDGNENTPVSGSVPTAHDLLQVQSQGRLKNFLTDKKYSRCVDFARSQASYSKLIDNLRFYNVSLSQSWRDVLVQSVAPFLKSGPGPTDFWGGTLGQYFDWEGAELAAKVLAGYGDDYRGLILLGDRYFISNFIAGGCKK